MIKQWQIIMAKTEVDGVKLLISSYNLHDALLSWTRPLIVSNLKFTSISVKVHTWMCPNKHHTIMQAVSVTYRWSQLQGHKMMVRRVQHNSVTANSATGTK